ncbi:MAG: ABC transporter substrate binding protein [Planctomycetes bacterium ADurb.Bin401]|nr:MAG: ABC transporter substrate binding protein [Planctomycetes bacterium ADurb.Bin401]
MKMRIKTEVIFAILLTFCFFGLNGCNKKKPRVYRIGIITGTAAYEEIVNSFKNKMKELNYRESENIEYDLHLANNHYEEEQILQKFVSDKVDLIFAFPTDPAIAAKKAASGTNIPVVFTMAGIESNDLIESILKPGGNISGVRFPNTEISAKRLEILKELIPNARRVYLIYDPNYPNAIVALDCLNQSAPELGIELVKETVNNLNDLERVLNQRGQLEDIGIDAIFILPELLTQSPKGFEMIMKFANEKKLAVCGAMPFTSENGAVFSMAPDRAEMGRESAIIVDKIFNGVPAGEIMVVTPGIRLIINYDSISKLGLTVPEGLLDRADMIIGQ